MLFRSWAAGGVVGPQITAFIKDNMPERASTLSFLVGAAFVLMGFVVSLVLPSSKKAPAKQ